MSPCPEIPPTCEDRYCAIPPRAGLLFLGAGDCLEVISVLGAWAHPFQTGSFCKHFVCINCEVRWRGWPLHSCKVDRSFSMGSHHSAGILKALCAEYLQHPVSIGNLCPVPSWQALAHWKEWVWRETSFYDWYVLKQDALPFQCAF